VGAHEAAGYRPRALGLCRAYGCLVTPSWAATGIECHESSTADLLALMARCQDPSTLWHAPDAEQLEHYRTDPRGRALLVARRPDGEPVAAALAVRAEVVGTQGIERIPMLESLFVPEPDADILRALLRDTARRWSDPATPTPVRAPSLCGLDPALLRVAGLRALPSGFEAYLFLPDADDPTPSIRWTNLEII
jgi:hypothetical protein